MGLEKSVTKYQTDYFRQEDMLSDHMSRVYRTFTDNKQSFEQSGSEAAKTLALDAASTYKMIDDTKRGVCAALCMKWMKLKIKGGAYPPMAKLKTDQTFAKAVIRQSSAKGAGIQQEQLANSYKVGWQKKELNFSRSLMAMAVDILEIPAVFYLLSFTLKQGSHVIALGSQDVKTVLIFDPNFGEFQVPASKLSPFLTDLLHQGYEMPPKAVNGLSRWTPP
jgi:hypothetical protein